MQIVDEIISHSDPQSLIDGVQSAVAEYGVLASGFAFVQGAGSLTGWGTSPDKWRKTYFEEGLDLEDPGYRRETRPGSAMLLQYDQGYPGRKTDAKMNAFCEVLRLGGRTASLFVPDMTVSGITHMAALTFVTDVPERHLAKWRDQEGRQVEALATLALHHGGRLTHTPGHPAQCPLSPRALEIVRRMAEGQQFAQIAHELKIARKTVEFHSAAMREKLGVRSREEAIAHCVRRGWI